MPWVLRRASFVADAQRSPCTAGASPCPVAVRVSLPAWHDLRQVHVPTPPGALGLASGFEAPPPPRGALSARDDCGPAPTTGGWRLLWVRWGGWAIVCTVVASARSAAKGRRGAPPGTRRLSPGGASTMMARHLASQAATAQGSAVELDPRACAGGPRLPALSGQVARPRLLVAVALEVEVEVEVEQAVGARGASVTPTGDTGRPVSNSIWGHCVCPLARGPRAPGRGLHPPWGALSCPHRRWGQPPDPLCRMPGGCRGRRCKDQRLNGRLRPGNAPLVGASRPSVAQAPATRLPALRRSIDPVGIARAEGGRRLGQRRQAHVPESPPTGRPDPCDIHPPKLTTSGRLLRSRAANCHASGMSRSAGGGQRVLPPFSDHEPQWRTSRRRRRPRGRSLRCAARPGLRPSSRTSTSGSRWKVAS